MSNSPQQSILFLDKASLQSTNHLANQTQWSSSHLPQLPSWLLAYLSPLRPTVRPESATVDTISSLKVSVRYVTHTYLSLENFSTLLI